MASDWKSSQNSWKIGADMRQWNTGHNRGATKRARPQRAGRLEESFYSCAEAGNVISNTAPSFGVLPAVRTP